MVFLMPLYREMNQPSVLLVKVIHRYPEGQIPFHNAGRTMKCPFQQAKQKESDPVDPDLGEYIGTIFLYGVDKPSVEERVDRGGQVGADKKQVDCCV